METIEYSTALFWYASWPIVIYVTYRFIVTNIEHLEKNIER